MPAAELGRGVEQVVPDLLGPAPVIAVEPVEEMMAAAVAVSSRTVEETMETSAEPPSKRARPSTIAIFDRLGPAPETISEIVRQRSGETVQLVSSTDSRLLEEQRVEYTQEYRSRVSRQQQRAKTTPAAAGSAAQLAASPEVRLESLGAPFCRIFAAEDRTTTERGRRAVLAEG